MAAPASTLPGAGDDGERTAAPLRDFRRPWPDLDGRTVLVTGGTGSFGRAFIAAVLREWSPRKLIVFSRDELKQYEMAQAFPQACMRWFIGDVRDGERLRTAMRGVDIVVHAAALKHVPIAEYNPFECIKTNVFGAQNVVDAAIAAGVQQVVALSTDKAASPINLYGASKLAADKIFTAAAAMAGEDGPRFSVVRYGNVMGSRGSVAPLFQRLAAVGEPLPITDPRMTRFWITLEQGVAFVLSSLAAMRRAEIFIPKLPSLTTVALARAIAPNAEQRLVGIRPGEKLHEAMLTEDDARDTLELEDRFLILPGHDRAARADWLARGARPVAEGFRYSSDANPETLDMRGLRALLQQAAIARVDANGDC